MDEICPAQHAMQNTSRQVFVLLTAWDPSDPIRVEALLV
jgi:hypothetical protein